MPIPPTTARSVDAQFLEMICGDTDLLHVEFDAIVSTEWPTSPIDLEARGTVDGDAGGAPARLTDPVSRPRHPGVGGWARQRAPPPRQPTTNETKPNEQKGR